MTSDVASILGLTNAASDDELRAWVEANPRIARDAAAAHRTLRAQLARDDVNEFIEYVMRDELTGARVRQAPVHRAFQSLATQHNRLIVWSHVEAGKTSQIAVGRVLWELGRDPNLRIGVCSNTMRQSSKILSTISSYIERSDELHQVFPRLRPGPRWGSGAITVRRQSLAKDPSVQVFGTNSGTPLGSRLDILVMDDILTYENTTSAAQREQTYDWYHATLAGRMTARSRVWFLGTAFHPDDTLHRLARSPAWHFARFPVMDLETGALNWPDRWPMERIEAKQKELGPHEAARQLFTKARDDTEARFKREWINRCLARGEGKAPALALASIPKGFRVFTGVDLAVSKKKNSDLTVLFTIIVHPDETREVLCVEAGKWSANEIIERIVDTHRRFGSIILVESNAAQDYIRQFVTAASAVPVREFNTGTNKLHPEFGIEGVAVEMSNAKWVIPNFGGAMEPQIQAWVDEMVYYDPSGHTGDRLMASWFAREAARQKPKKAQKGRLDTLRR